MSKKKIIVTGGLGYIGSHTVVELVKAGYEPIIIDDLSNSQIFIADNIEKITAYKPVLYVINMCDKKKLDDVFLKEGKIDAIVHFAAFKAVGESVKFPVKYFKNNLISLINLLECMQEYKAENIVFSSSATVYGQPDELPVTETTVFKKALSAYGSTKQMGEEILEKAAAAGAVKSIALRYFNPVGAHESALLGELPLGTPNNLMPFITQVAIGKQPSLTVFGDDYNTPDGTCVRDYIHVVDLAKAHVVSCDRLIANKSTDPFEVFNIGTGKGISVLELIQAFRHENNVKLNYTIGKRRTGDAESIYADVSLAEKILDWRTEKGIADMVSSSWKWENYLKQNTPAF